MTIIRRQLLRHAATLAACALFSAPLLAGQAAGAGAPAHGNPQVKFVTTEGTFTVELYPDKAPKTVANFLQYVRDKHYDGTIFHRVIANFMIQGGGYDKQYQEKPTRTPIVNEANNGLSNSQYTIAMARRSDPNSATAQFFINTVNNKKLDYSAPTLYGSGYAVFGRVISGEQTVEKIRNTPTGSGGPFDSDVPQTPVVIESATIVP